MAINPIDGAKGVKSSNLPEQQTTPALQQGQHKSRRVFQVMPQASFQKLSKAEQDILRQAERITRREQRKANRAASKEEAINPNPPTANYSDPYTVVIELANMADSLDISQAPEAVLMLNQAISAFLKQIDKQEEQRAERIREEQEQDAQDQKIYQERREKEERIRQQTLERITKENQLRQQWFNDQQE